MSCAGRQALGSVQLAAHVQGAREAQGTVAWPVPEVLFAELAPRDYASGHGDNKYPSHDHSQQFVEQRQEVVGASETNFGKNGEREWVVIGGDDAKVINCRNRMMRINGDLMGLEVFSM